MLLRIVTAFNAINGQVWAFALILLGIGGFGIACFCVQSDVRTTLMTAATTMIGGGIGILQHKPETLPPTPEPTVVPVAPVPPAA